MHSNHHFHYLHNREMNELYLSVAIRSFALSMVSVFVPIYLLQMGYTLAEVFLFFIAFSLAHIIFALPAAHIASKFGFKHSILFSIPLLMLFIFGLHTLEQFNWSLYALALIVGLAGDLYWISYHIDFSLFSDKDHRGKEVGMARIATLLFHALGPIMGGYLLVTTGFSALFTIVSVLLFVSAVPLFFTSDVHQPWKLSWRNIFRGQKLKNIVVFLGHGFESGAALIIWPIFIFFVIVNDFSTLGFVTSLSLVFSLLFTFAVGRMSDAKERLVLKLGAFLNMIVWFGRFAVRTTSHVIGVDALYGVSQALVRIPFDAITYDKANKIDIVKFITLREIVIHAGRVILFAVMFILVTTKHSFILAGLASLLYFLF